MNKEMITVYLPKTMVEHDIPNEILLEGLDDSNKDYEIERIITKENNIKYTKEQYKKMGFVVLKEYNDLLFEVLIPNDWELKSIDALWSHLYDNKGRRRADIMCKYSGCDAGSFIRFKKRYTYWVNHIGDEKLPYEEWAKSDLQGQLFDSGKLIFTTKSVSISPNISFREEYKIKEELGEEVLNYLNLNFPNYNDVFAYWND